MRVRTVSDVIAEHRGEQSALTILTLDPPELSPRRWSGVDEHVTWWAWTQEVARA